jgi:hypothetical protein
MGERTMIPHDLSEKYNTIPLTICDLICIMHVW